MFSFIARLRRGERLEAPPITPPGDRRYVPGPDEGAAPPGVPEQESIVQRAFLIEYGAGGVPGFRRIVAHGCYAAKGVTYLQAYCQERRASRSFRVDRIVSVADGVTGEVLGSPAAIFVPTERRATAKPPKSPRQTLLRRGLRVLATVARADGSVHPSEQAVMRAYVAAALGLDDTDALEGFVNYGLSLAPRFEAFLDSVDEICGKDPELAALTMTAALKLAEADGRITAEEDELLGDIAAIFRANDVQGRVSG